MVELERQAKRQITITPKQQLINKQQEVSRIWGNRPEDISNRYNQ